MVRCAGSGMVGSREGQVSGVSCQDVRFLPCANEKATASFTQWLPIRLVCRFRGLPWLPWLVLAVAVEKPEHADFFGTKVYLRNRSVRGQPALPRPGLLHGGLRSGLREGGLRR